MKVDKYNVTFIVTTYENRRKAVAAITTVEGQEGNLYEEITINIPQYPLEDEEVFLNPGSLKLIEIMIKKGYLEIVDEIIIEDSLHKIGRFTQKFIDEYERVKDENERLRDYLIGCIESDEDLVELGYHENEKFINEVIEEYKDNLKYVEYEYSEIDAKDDAIETVSKRWLKEI